MTHPGTSIGRIMIRYTYRRNNRVAMPTFFLRKYLYFFFRNDIFFHFKLSQAHLNKYVKKSRVKIELKLFFIQILFLIEPTNLKLVVGRYMYFKAIKIGKTFRFFKPPFISVQRVCQCQCQCLYGRFLTPNQNNPWKSYPRCSWVKEKQRGYKGRKEDKRIQHSKNGYVGTINLLLKLWFSKTNPKNFTLLCIRIKSMSGA